ncbi:MAG: phosphoglycerate kinase [Candidatus Promineifilaceae bacterium]|nr:phosphoglycerate kinase [Candidatus Promineifilaceae bacterium]
MNKKTVRDIDVKGKKVLVRVDFNVPLSSKDPAADIHVTDDTRIEAALPTINYLLEHKAALILCSHLGRPKSPEDKHLSMDPVAARLGQLIERDVQKVDEVIGPAAQAAAAALQSGQVLLLENTRFAGGEKKNDAELAANLAALADVYVNDAFGSAHRAHASTAGVAEAMRADGKAAVAGFLMKKELEALNIARDNPPQPYMAIMGGAKISDKIQLIDHLLGKTAKILVGGGMANTFLKAKGLELGRSLVEEEAVPEARRLLDQAGDKLVLPVDVVVAASPESDEEPKNVPVAEIPADKMALDVGLVTIQHFSSTLEEAQLVVWNGPMGVFEVERFAAGTRLLATLLAGMVDRGAQVIIGGGDSAAAVTQAGLADRMTHVSTGGGASLEFLEGRTLPGVAALDDK